MKVWTLLIHHKHGEDVTVFSTYDKALEYLHAYIEYWIKMEFEPSDFESEPNTPERIEEYMTNVDEYANIEETILDQKYEWNS